MPADGRRAPGRDQAHRPTDCTGGLGADVNRRVAAKRSPCGRNEDLAGFIGGMGLLWSADQGRSGSSDQPRSTRAKRIDRTIAPAFGGVTVSAAVPVAVHARAMCGPRAIPVRSAARRAAPTVTSRLLESLLQATSKQRFAPPRGGPGRSVAASTFGRLTEARIPSPASPHAADRTPSVGSAGLALAGVRERSRAW